VTRETSTNYHSSLQSLVWSEWCKTARKRPTKAELAQCSEITGRLNDEDYQWTLYATYFWARLMERVRLKYWRDPENRNNLQLTGAVCGTLMLSAVGTYTELPIPVGYA
jgi:hypothetical protein